MPSCIVRSMLGSGRGKIDIETIRSWATHRCMTLKHGMENHGVVDCRSAGVLFFFIFLLVRLFLSEMTALVAFGL